MVIWLINHLKHCSFHRQMGALKPAASMTKNSGQGRIKCHAQYTVKWLLSCFSRNGKGTCLQLLPQWVVLHLGLAPLCLAKATGTFKGSYLFIPQRIEIQKHGAILFYLYNTVLPGEGIYMAE